MITKFYINPITGRMIKSSGKTFKKLKDKKKYSSFEKEHCLYNVKSAKKCFSKLLKIYPGIVYPSSNFINIPKTYNGTGFKGLRVFIQDDNYIIGFVDKKGNIYRLNKYIKNDIQNKNIPTVIDYYNILPKIIKKLPKINAKIQKKILHQIDSIKPLKNTHILFNHVQKDFIPINKKMTKKDHDKILNIFNDNLIKTQTIDIKDYPIISTPSSTAPSTVSSSVLSGLPSSVPSSVLSSVPSSVLSSVPSTRKLSRTLSVPSTRKLSRTLSVPSIKTKKISRTLSIPSIKTKKISSDSSENKFELDLIDNKLMKKIFENSVKSKGIKIIENEKGDIIGYTE